MCALSLLTASTFYISFIAEKCLYTRIARPNQSRIFAFVSVGKNKNKNGLNQKLILKCPFVPRWPRNSFFSCNYASEEEESYNDRAYQAYTQNSQSMDNIVSVFSLPTSTSKSQFQIRALEYFI